MWCVRMSIAREDFFETMHDFSGWLSEQDINSPQFSYSRQRSGDIKFRIDFAAAADADRFAARFAGRVLPPDRLPD